ncbi:MAG: NosD domain-containing protein [Candidatus Thermoplasmatota archaeon]|jgi:polygalacturonase|nr:NosD domain-containing protein [Candidatus Thermoplasmatota archaeon]
MFGGSGPDNYTRIQDAIDNASDGDTVFVYDDSSPYSGWIFVNKSITVQGENTNTTIIQGPSGNFTGFIIDSDFVKISGFTIQNGGAGIKIEDFSDNIIENCIFF